MRPTVSELCEKFIENRDKIKSAFIWESSYLYPVCAAIFTNQRQSADISRMKDCQGMLKARTGIFSEFRGTAKLAMISMLAVDSDPGSKLQKSLQVYDFLKAHFFKC